MKGWVYIITNKSMPKLLKVGFSTKDPELRAEELNTTGVPHRYVVEYDALVNEPYKIEQKAHALLKAYHENKEWFRCDIATAIAAVRQSANRELILENVKNAEVEAESQKIERLRAEINAKNNAATDAQLKLAKYLKAAEQGNANAQLYLGLMYARADSIEKDEAQAVVWFLKSAEQGCAIAQANLGTMYKYGKGVTKDETQAAYWYRKAANQGQIDAQIALRKLEQ